MKQIVLILALILTAFQTAPAASTSTITYQGRLLDSLGEPVTSQVTMGFTFWDAEAGGNQLGDGFSDSDAVTPNSDGLYATQIGDAGDNPIPASIFDADAVWLEITIDGETLSPRKQVTAVGYSIQSETVNGANVGRMEFVAARNIEAGEVVALTQDGECVPARFVGVGEPGSTMYYSNESIPLSDNRCLVHCTYTDEDYLRFLYVTDLDVEGSDYTEIPDGGSLGQFTLHKINGDKALILKQASLENGRAYYSIVDIDNTNSTLCFTDWAPLLPIETDHYVTAKMAGSFDDEYCVFITQDWDTSGSESSTSCKIIFCRIVDNALTVLDEIDSSVSVKDGVYIENGRFAMISTSYMDSPSYHGVNIITCNTGETPSMTASDWQSLEIQNIGSSILYYYPLGEDSFVVRTQVTENGYEDILYPVVTNGDVISVGEGYVMGPSIYTGGVAAPQVGGVDSPGGDKVIYCYGQTAYILTLNDSSFTASEPIHYNENNNGRGYPTALTSDLALVFYYLMDSSSGAILTPYHLSAISSEGAGNLINFGTRIGIAEESASAGKQLMVTTIGGTSRQFSDLAPGENYYAVNGGISLTGTDLIGVALNSDTLMIMR